MNGTTIRMPARRRLAAAAAATALTAGPAAVAGAGPAHATGDQGSASAAVLRTGLDVALLDKTVNVPLAVSLNEVRAPRSADRTALKARLDGVDGGQPFSVLSAEVASARATVDDHKAEARTELAHARLHVPGLPLLSLIEVDGVTSSAVCEAGKAPVARADVVGSVTVLGKRVTLTAGGPTRVKVPGVGEVRLELSQRRTASRTAAATALELDVSINPLKLNVAEVEGELSLAKASCTSPGGTAAAPPASQGPSGSAPAGGSAGALEAQQAAAPAEVGRAGLAETGGSPVTPYVAGGAVALLVAGGGALVLARRRT
ncbi:LPXTG cell wall anchor domain-containing protein [Streptomyces sp. MUM 136J]|uniref:SCO1860 family LAETG-anchored protein n=1 Tax=Streptomyces sp. MUM 136J TaxID=2791992 RepID=UPI001F047EB8|nr:SCO1860 family LAETG-anchored protein [Streptomyces sp. MUM 136J]MCH0567860.1 LPXTG cell wall anchor domain-containing protein [Streptomyces sp. MUM 136J]